MQSEMTEEDWADVMGAELHQDTVEVGGASMPITQVNLRINKDLAQELTPTSLPEGREQRKYELGRRRASQQRDAFHFLVTGLSRGIPPYGKEWNREYNPWPYPEAKPDPYEYEDTGVGAIYGFDGSQRHMWQLAGWIITRKHAEERKRRK